MNIGKLPVNVLKQSILKQIHTKNDEVISGAGVGVDCAFFASEKDIIVSCMQEAAVAARADAQKAGAHVSTMAGLITKCANNLAISGADPAAVMITLFFPADSEPDDVKALMSEAEEACAVLGMQICGGQSRIINEITIPLAVVTGYGSVNQKDSHSLKCAGPNQDIVLSKWIGLEGTAILSRHFEDRINDKYPSYLSKEAMNFDRYLSIIREARAACMSGVCAMHDASEGGIFASLWELAEGAGIGLDIDIKKLPLRQETVEVCECCGANPYELMSGGCLVMTTTDGEGLKEALLADNINASIIGRTTAGKAKIIRNEDEVRYMDRPKQDEVYRLLV